MAAGQALLPARRSPPLPSRPLVIGINFSQGRVWILSDASSRKLLLLRAKGSNTRIEATAAAKCACRHIDYQHNEDCNSEKFEYDSAQGSTPPARPLLIRLTPLGTNANTLLYISNEVPGEAISPLEIVK